MDENVISKIYPFHASQYESMTTITNEEEIKQSLIELNKKTKEERLTIEYDKASQASQDSQGNQESQDSKNKDQGNNQYITFNT